MDPIRVPGQFVAELAILEVDHKCRDRSSADPDAWERRSHSRRRGNGRPGSRRRRSFRRSWARSRFAARAGTTDRDRTTPSRGGPGPQTRGCTGPKARGPWPSRTDGASSRPGRSGRHRGSARPDRAAPRLRRRFASAFLSAAWAVSFASCSLVAARSFFSASAAICPATTSDTPVASTSTAVSTRHQNRDPRVAPGPAHVALEVRLPACQDRLVVEEPPQVFGQRVGRRVTSLWRPCRSP